jgi:hypothetical protein
MVEAVDRALIATIDGLTGVLAVRLVSPLVSPERFATTPTPPAASVDWRGQPAPADSVSACVRHWSIDDPPCDFGPPKLVRLEP